MILNRRKSYLEIGQKKKTTCVFSPNNDKKALAILVGKLIPSAQNIIWTQLFFYKLVSLVLYLIHA